ncbi:chemotaxis protein CheX [Ammoniphilus sp. CFH 90114]|uniref:chemotaxis protein CheX n=1 Tax=Ammoniphilus sp. CFH 90114 TaxID=2493665 RepID=UPI00100FA51D|nr:chemotaxis protein CheX [Ammoniphilus sp. CFH 90114]RXT13964.1 chemotaxis protein CheX [Ammoniphilus sp. CFH 90114]
MDEKIAPIIEGTLESISTIIPLPVSFQSPTWFKAPVHQKELGVLVSLTGDLHIRFILDGKMDTLCKLGESMFGMQLDNQMLESFAGELGNMIVGNLSTYLAGRGYVIDITPPTVMVGETKLYGFDQAVSIPFEMETIGQLNMVIIIDKD